MLATSSATSRRPLKVLPANLAVFAFYLAVAVGITYPLVTVLATRFAGFGYSDAYETAQHIWWFKYALQHGQPMFYQTLMGYPTGIDGLTLWLSAVMGDDATGPDPVLDGPLTAALAAIAARPGPVVIVSDEVGWGIVPMHAGARVYRDLTGIAHQRIATMADEVHLLVAGLPIRLKGPSE